MKRTDITEQGGRIDEPERGGGRLRLLGTERPRRSRRSVRLGAVARRRIHDDESIAPGGVSFSACSIKQKIVLLHDPRICLRVIYKSKHEQTRIVLMDGR